jgi:two-component system response regulator (stage 0 sporulation protein F)
MHTILFADDKRNICEYCRRELEDEGYRVIVAHNGAEALQLTTRHSPEVIILDICMPGINGLEAAERIKRLQPEVPVVFFTSFDDLCLQDKRSRYATACVEKREDLTELKRAVTGALQSRGGAQEYHLGLPPIGPAAAPPDKEEGCTLT